MAIRLNPFGSGLYPPGCVDVIIPTWRARRYMPGLILALQGQTTPPASITVIDSGSHDGTVEMAAAAGWRTSSINQADFNHGGTRNTAASLGSAPLIAFLTQDAVPSPDWLETLAREFSDQRIAAAYSRQTPHPDADPPERFAREFNYPDQSEIRTLADVPRLGFRAYFFSNVASMVRRERFDQVGGFPVDVVMDEDVVLCSRLLHAGWSVAYSAHSIVIHSHNYSILQQFRRYFDLGAFLSTHGNLLPGAAIQGQGLQFAIRQMAWLWSERQWWWLLRCPFELAAKWLGVHCGRWIHTMPMNLIRKASMHPHHWRRPQ